MSNVQELRNRILGFKTDVPTMEVEGIGTIGCKTLSAAEFFELSDHCRRDDVSNAEAMACTLVACAVDPESGEELFTKAHVPALASSVPFAIMESVTAWMSNVQIPKKAELEGN